MNKSNSNSSYRIPRATNKKLKDIELPVIFFCHFEKTNKFKLKFIDLTFFLFSLSFTLCMCENIWTYLENFITCTMIALKTSRAHLDNKKPNNFVNGFKLSNSNNFFFNNDKLNLNAATKHTNSVVLDALDSIDENDKNFGLKKLNSLSPIEKDLDRSADSGEKLNRFKQIKTKFKRRRRRIRKRENERKKIAHKNDQKLVANSSDLIDKIKIAKLMNSRNESLLFNFPDSTSLSNLPNLTFSKNRIQSNDSFFCDPKHYFDCTLGNLDNLNLFNLTRHQTRLVPNGLSDENAFDDKFSYCIPIEKKCDSQNDCPFLINQTLAADESELVCGKKANFFISVCFFD